MRVQEKILAKFPVLSWKDTFYLREIMVPSQTFDENLLLQNCTTHHIWLRIICSPRICHQCISHITTQDNECLLFDNRRGLKIVFTMDDSSSLPLLVSNHELNANEDYLLLLLAIIKSKNWTALRCLINSSPATFQFLARKVARAPDLQRHVNILFFYVPKSSCMLSIQPSIVHGSNLT